MDFWMLTAFTNKEFLVVLHFPKVLFLIPNSSLMKVGNNDSCCLSGSCAGFPLGCLSSLHFPEVRRWGGHTAASRRFRVPQTTSRVSGDSCFLSRTGDVGDKSGKWGPGVPQSDSGLTARAWLWRDAISLPVELPFPVLPQVSLKVLLCRARAVHPATNHPVEWLTEGSSSVSKFLPQLMEK